MDQRPHPLGSNQDLSAFNRARRPTTREWDRGSPDPRTRRGAGDLRAPWRGAHVVDSSVVREPPPSVGQVRGARALLGRGRAGSGAQQYRAQDSNLDLTGQSRPSCHWTSPVQVILLTIWRSPRVARASVVWPDRGRSGAGFGPPAAWRSEGRRWSGRPTGRPAGEEGGGRRVETKGWGVQESHLGGSEDGGSTGRPVSLAVYRPGVRSGGGWRAPKCGKGHRVFPWWPFRRSVEKARATSGGPRGTYPCCRNRGLRRPSRPPANLATAPRSPGLTSRRERASSRRAPRCARRRGDMGGDWSWRSVRRSRCGSVLLFFAARPVSQRQR